LEMAPTEQSPFPLCAPQHFIRFLISSEWSWDGWKNEWTNTGSLFLILFSAHNAHADLFCSRKEAASINLSLLWLFTFWFLFLGQFLMQQITVHCSMKK
jgi:hypothetical protein